MKKKEILRGRGSFTRILEQGSRVDGELVRCYVLLEASGGPRLTVGFSVPRKVSTAVSRNRVRRLLREAFRQERDLLLGALERSPRTATLLFVYRPRRAVDVRRLTLRTVQPDMTSICRAVRAKW